MLTFGASAYLWLYAPERLTQALSPAIRRLTLIASVVALLTAIVWLALEIGLDGRRLERRRRSRSDRRRSSPTPPSAMRGRAHLLLAAALVAVVVFGPRARWAPDGRRLGGAAGEPRPRRPRGDADRGRRGPASRATTAVHLLTTGAWIGALVPFADVPWRLRARRTAARGGHGDDPVFLLAAISSSRRSFSPAPSISR